MRTGELFGRPDRNVEGNLLRQKNNPKLFFLVSTVFVVVILRVARPNCSNQIRQAFLAIRLNRKVSALFLSIKDLIEAHLKDPGRPSPDNTQPRPPPNIKHRVFPEAVDSVPLTKA